MTKNLDCKPLTACKENSGLLPTRQRWNCCSAKMTPLFPPTLAIIYPLVNKHRPLSARVYVNLPEGKSYRLEQL